MSEHNENAQVSAEEAKTETVESTLTESNKEQMGVAENGNVPAHKKYSITLLMEQEYEFEDDKANELDKLFDETLATINENEIITGKIVTLNSDEVAIDIGFKSEGVVALSEFKDADELKLGDEVEVFLETLEDKEGRLILSRRRADFMRVWEKINEAFETQEILKAKILRRIKGGMVVDLMGVDAFLPGSQIDVKPVRDFDSWLDRELDVRVVKVNHPNENVVVSHKVLLEESLAEQRTEILKKLEKGLVLEGHVKAIAEFGVFVDLGGVDGLVHITDLSWGRVAHPSEIVELDEKIKVVVLDFDDDKRRISLGMKQLTSHPWDTIGEKYEAGSKVSGKVVSLTDYGAFIEIEKGIEGLIHISEMSWTEHIKHPSQFVSMGQEVEAVVLTIDKNAKKLSLGMKQLQPDPWKELLKKYPVDSTHPGIVRNITNFGVFVELELGVDGLVHISDLSWTKKIRHPGEFVKRNEELEVAILSIDLDQRRISLGHKQVKENPWERFAELYNVGISIEGRIVRILEKGVVVELPEGVDGFVPTSQLSFAPVRNIADYFRVDEFLPLRVIEFDKEAKKIVLSCVEHLKVQSADKIEKYNINHPVPGAEENVASFLASREESPEAEAVEASVEEVAEKTPVAQELPNEMKVDSSSEEATPTDEVVETAAEETPDANTEEAKTPAEEA